MYIPNNNNLSAIFVLLPSSGPLAGKTSPRSFSIVWKEGGGRQEGRSTATGVAGDTLEYYQCATIII